MTIEKSRQLAPADREMPSDRDGADAEQRGDRRDRQLFELVHDDNSAAPRREAVERTPNGRPGDEHRFLIAGDVWRPINDENEVEPKDGSDLYTTLDINIQDVAEHAIDAEQLARLPAGLRERVAVGVTMRRMTVMKMTVIDEY